ncbi:hypothetical protein S245_055320, partial [Arachis hypogaea]
ILALTPAFNVTGDHYPYFIKCFLPCVLSGICGPLRKLMEQNAQAFNQITNNLSSYKLQDNIDLFCRTRHNICSILNESQTQITHHRAFMKLGLVLASLLCDQYVIGRLGGGGSDYKPFVQHVGILSIDIAFGG